MQPFRRTFSILIDVQLLSARVLSINWSSSWYNSISIKSKSGDSLDWIIAAGLRDARLRQPKKMITDEYASFVSISNETTCSAVPPDQLSGSDSYQPKHTVIITTFYASASETSVTTMSVDVWSSVTLDNFVIIGWAFSFCLQSCPHVVDVDAGELSSVLSSFNLERLAAGDA